MKLESKSIMPLMAALLCVAMAQGAKARDDSDKAKDYSASDTRSEGNMNQGAPTKCNRASSIIGMDVRNQNNEHLGHIKDLVIDLRKDSVSYAVMTTASKVQLGINEKLLAVPLSALTASADQKYLVLNADKAKVEAAAGFDKDNWPNVGSPSWGAEPFWQKDVTGKPETKSDSDTDRK
jgi:sporulation protein YlmC with PRC-barrel domain